LNYWISASIKFVETAALQKNAEGRQQDSSLSRIKMRS